MASELKGRHAVVVRYVGIALELEEDFDSLVFISRINIIFKKIVKLFIMNL